MTPDEAVKQFKPLVYFHVGKWLKRHPRLKNQKDDLVQDGFVGLMKAYKCFDPAKGKFFAHAWNHVSFAVRVGVTKIIGMTSRPTHYKPLRTEVWKNDYSAVDAEGVPVSPASLRGNGRTPEEIVMLQELADGLSRRLRGRDGDIYRKRLEAEDTYAGGILRGTSAASIGEEYGLSRERVRQITKGIDESLRAWGERILKEAA